MEHNKAMEMCFTHIRAHVGQFSFICILYIISTSLAPISLKYLNSALTWESEPIQVVFVSLTIHCVLKLVSVLGELGSSRLFQSFSLRVGTLVKQDLINKLFTVDLEEQKKIESSDWQSKLSLCDDLADAVIYPIIKLAHIIFTIFPCFYVLVSLSSMFAFIIILPILVYYVSVSVFIKKILPLYDKKEKARIQIWRHLSEVLNGFEDIRTNGSIKEIERQNKDYTAQSEKAVHNVISMEGKRSFCEIILYVGLIIILLFAGGVQHVPVGTLITMFFSIQMLYTSLEEINEVRTRWQSSKAIALQLHHLFELKERTEGNIAPMGTAKKAFEMRAVDFSRGTELIIKNANLEIYAGDFVIIQGPSGIGKSTLLDLLLGIISPSYGEIRAFGVRLEDILKRDFYQKISFMPQFPTLLKGDVEYNILLGSETGFNWDTFARDIDLNLQAHDSIESLGEGVSGGQRQRIGFLRVIASDPEVYIFDEPSSSVDYQTEKKMCSILKNINRTKTIIVVSHRETFNELANVRVMLDSEHQLSVLRKER